MKPVKYKITYPYGLRQKGDIIDVYLIANDVDDDGKGLLYHPCDNDEYSSVSIARKVGEFWIDMNEDSYVNISTKDAQAFKRLIKS